MLWSDAEIHHIQPHSNGGSTNLENGALVHKACHPKSQKDVADFEKHWKLRVTSGRKAVTHTLFSSSPTGRTFVMR